MEWQKYFNTEIFQKRVLIGLCLILLAGMTVLTMFLNWQFSAKMIQLENAAMSNSARLTDIDNFLVQLAQQLKTQKSQADLQNVLSDISSAPQE